MLICVSAVESGWREDGKGGREKCERGTEGEREREVWQGNGGRKGEVREGEVREGGRSVGGRE